MEAVDALSRDRIDRNRPLLSGFGIPPDGSVVPSGAGPATPALGRQLGHSGVHSALERYLVAVQFHLPGHPGVHLLLLVAIVDVASHSLECGVHSALDRLGRWGVPVGKKGRNSGVVWSSSGCSTPCTCSSRLPPLLQLPLLLLLKPTTPFGLHPLSYRIGLSRRHQVLLVGSPIGIGLGDDLLAGGSAWIDRVEDSRGQGPGAGGR